MKVSQGFESREPHPKTGKYLPKRQKYKPALYISDVLLQVSAGNKLYLDTKVVTHVAGSLEAGRIARLPPNAILLK
jgi:hypothetical protein